MNRTQLEEFVLSVLDRVTGGRKFEDSRVELKREWPTEHRKAARRLAAHCNPAGGEWVLWIIGLNEDGSWQEKPDAEPQEWLAQVGKHFDGIAPTCIIDLKVPFRDKLVTALLFDTGRAPYVVKLSPEEQKGQDGASHDVPWRDGTFARSARREDLVRMLAPIARAPAIDLLGGYLKSYAPGQRHDNATFSGTVHLYFVPRGLDRAVIPFHTLDLLITTTEAPWFAHCAIERNFMPDVSIGTGLVHQTPSEIILNGPGSTRLDFVATSSDPIPQDVQMFAMGLTFKIAGDAGQHKFNIAFARPDASSNPREWLALHGGQ